MGVIEIGRGNAPVMNTYIKKNGCHLDSISGYATVMNTYMENKKIIGSQDVKTYRLQMVGGKGKKYPLLISFPSRYI